MPVGKQGNGKSVSLERLRYANDIRKFVKSELGFLHAQTVIDAGCGNGFVSRAINASGKGSDSLFQHSDFFDPQDLVQVSTRCCAESKSKSTP